ncbi:MAG: DUF3108 domain-containing protein [Hyphomicrobium sp.]|jgi:hypothetical protein
MYQFSFRSLRAAIVSAGAIFSLLALPAPHLASPSAMAAGISAADVDATYKITLNGFELGSFHFGSNVEQDHYTLDTDIEISAFLGVIHWKGATRSTGAIAAKSPKPADFLFEYESSAKAGSVKIGFGEKGVESLSVEPVALALPDEIPLTEAHLKGVLDPLTAIMALTHVDAPTPCGRKVAIFDGKQRFDLDLQFARAERLAGTSETALVCRVKYQPIAGYTPTDETRALAASNEIEIAFRPVPAAKLMLPQSVSLPTPAGHARLDLVQIRVKAARGQVASVN